jgi:outer membrane biosynthesis protein TonB
MKLIETLSTAVLLLLPLTIAPAYAQKEHEEEKEPQQKQQQAKPAAKPAQHQQAKPQQQHAQQQQTTKPAQQSKQAARQQQAKPAQQSKQARHQQTTKPAQQQANRSQPAGNHGRIPDDRFRASFGREHSFHVNRSDFEGSRRFQYGGFWFNVLDPWPVGWLYTDNVYVDYINGGYFLCDPIHPGVNISINIG